MKNPKTVYIENCTFYGRVLCTQCGSNTDLSYVQMMTRDMKDQWETVICRSCIQDIPSFDEETEEETI